MTSRRVGGDYTIQLIARIAVILLDGLTKPALRDMASRCLLKTTGTKGDLKRRLNSYMARRRTFREPYVGTRSQSKEPRKNDTNRSTTQREEKKAQQPKPKPEPKPKPKIVKRKRAADDSDGDEIQQRDTDRLAKPRKGKKRDGDPKPLSRGRVVRVQKRITHSWKR